MTNGSVHPGHAALTRALGDDLAERLPQGSVRFDVPLARLGTYRIGGPAAAVVQPRSAEVVAAVVRFAREADVPWLAIGLGSNLLFPDEGFEGIILRIGKGLATVTRSGPQDTMWTVGAGLPTPILARRTAAAGLAGVHRLVGVPGAVGGGVFMNAGAHGQEYRDVVRGIDLVTPDGDVQAVAGTDVAWAYRSSGLSGVVIGATLALEPDDPAALKRDLTRYLVHRREGTPFDQPCCGSVFRNPAAEEAAALDWSGSVTAGRLIDAAGLKGMRIGGAEVSPRHANYIVNVGEASSADVVALIEACHDTVAERFGISLQREVRMVQASGGIR